MTSAVDRTSSPRSSLSSPWSHVVRGEEQSSGGGNGGGGGAASSFPSASPILSPKLPGRSPRKQSVVAHQLLSSVDLVHGGSGNFAGDASISCGKKPVWNVPSNGTIEAGSVIDTISWPALSESARSSPKSSSSDSTKALSDGSVSASPGSVASYPSSNHSSSNQNANSTPNASSSSRHKIVKRGAVSGIGGGSSSSSRSAASEPSPVFTETSPKSFPDWNSSNNNNNNGGNDHQRGYGGRRKGSTGQHNNHGNRRDPERGDHEWSRHRDFGRDVHMQLHQQRGDRPYSRPPPVAPAPFIAPPPPLGAFANHIGFPDFPSVYYVAASPHAESLRAVPFAPHQVPAPPVIFFPAPDPQRAMLLKQIEYYFSQDNLCKDLYLRQNMDEHGWVPISLIASFNKVKKLTNSIPYIVDTVQQSSLVEVQGEKLRKRNDWKSWLLPHTHLGSASASQSPTLTIYEGLAAQFDNVGLDNTPKNNSISRLDYNEAALTRAASGNLNSQLPLVRDSNEDEGSQAAVHFD